MILPKYVISGASVNHLPKRIDWVRDEAVAHCGETGEPEGLTSDTRFCKDCMDEL